MRVTQSERDFKGITGAAMLRIDYSREVEKLTWKLLQKPRGLVVTGQHGITEAVGSEQIIA